MREWSPSRRTVLRAGSALGVTALAGCLGGGPAGGGDASPVDGVPAGVTFVVHADVAALLGDEQLRTRLNDLLGRAADRLGFAFTSVEAALDEIESSVGLDPRDLERATLFAGYEPDSPAGLRLSADWSESAILDAAGSGVEPESDTYNGRTVHRYSDESALGVLESGEYVVGTTAGVEGAIDVAAGDAEPVSGRVRDSFTAAPAGPLRFAFESPPDLGEGSSGPGPVDPSVFGTITHGYGGYVSGGGDSSGSLTLETDSPDGAESVASELRAARDTARENLDGEAVGQELAEELDAMLASIEVTADGSRVTVAVGEGEVLPVVLLAVLSTFLLGLGSTQQPAPQVAFDFDYDSSADELTILHTGGDSVAAAELAVQGEGLGATGTWTDLGGSASGTIDGEPAVAAGDRVTVSAEPDYVARVVWESSDGTTASELAVDRGPEA